MFNLARRNKKQGILLLGRAKKPKMLYLIISDVGIRGIYLSLTLGTTKFKQLEIFFFTKSSYYVR